MRRMLLSVKPQAAVEACCIRSRVERSAFQRLLPCPAAGQSVAEQVWYREEPLCDRCLAEFAK
ncbi:hypothetical protein SacmaDRAFT_0429 [Saccharomonospora marina XMU15]|uniref:Uncharacterized protein n=1 Tax=Saccharomonospora marina XMU15 TaxID=882083 RepID=H5X2D7_9PSEU|nr:hypothetical protein SacmaDRAFT_0429 [Saccharomonospora marina XMU15]